MKPEDLKVGAKYQYTNAQLDYIFRDASSSPLIFSREDLADNIFIFKGVKNGTKANVKCKLFLFDSFDNQLESNFTEDELYQLEEK